MKKILSEKIKKKKKNNHPCTYPLDTWILYFFSSELITFLSGKKNPTLFCCNSISLTLSSLSHTGTLMNSLVYTYATLRSFCTSSSLIQKFKGFAVSFDTRFSSKKNKSCFPDETRQGIFQLTAFPWFYKRLLIRYPFLPLLFFHFLLIISA